MWKTVLMPLMKYLVGRGLKLNFTTPTTRVIYLVVLDKVCLKTGSKIGIGLYIGSLTNLKLI